MALFVSALQTDAGECKPTHTVKEFLQVWNDAVTGPGNRSHACTLGLLTPDARIIGVISGRDAKPQRVIETPKQFVEWYHQHPNEMFWEQTLPSTVDLYENVARVTKTYEVRNLASGPIKATGIEDFELMFVDGEWKAFSMLCQDATPGKPLPERYLPAKE